MPKLWSETIEAHRREVRDAILDTAAALANEHGLLSVTMAQIAEETGIGRATLYKYFPDVEAILVAWHERHVAEHLAQLAEVRDRADDAAERLEAVLEAYALHTHQRCSTTGRSHRDHSQQSQHGQSRQLHGSELAALVHRREHLAHAQQRLGDFVQELLSEGVAAGVVRDDVAPAELASYCLHALKAAGSLPSKAAVRRLVAVTLAGLRPSQK